jgi:methionine-rich copper-binding protein CopC
MIYIENLARGRPTSGHFSIISLLVSLWFSPVLLAQHTMHIMPAEGDLQVATMPENNEVLAAAPSSIMLHFESDVSLVKLVVKEARQGFIDIGFRYQHGVHFVQPLPALAAADYYTAEWAVLDDQGKLIKGTFHFSFGAEAKPPSFYLDQMEQMQHIMAPDYRLL